MNINNPAQWITLAVIIGLSIVYLIIVHRRTPEMLKNKAITLVVLGIIFLPFLMISVTLVQQAITNQIPELFLFPAVILVLLGLFLWRFLR